MGRTPPSGPGFLLPSLTLPPLEEAGLPFLPLKNGKGSENFSAVEVLDFTGFPTTFCGGGGATSCEAT